MSSSWNELGIEEILDPLPGEQLALGVLAFDRSIGAGMPRLVPTPAEIVDPVLHRSHAATLLQLGGPASVSPLTVWAGSVSTVGRNPAQTVWWEESRPDGGGVSRG
ncbi:MAG: hypothetical protein WKF58_19985 [Ilumatobacteraceae bacterium]